MYHLGLSVSYDRILELENQITTSLCNITDEVGLVCPCLLHHDLFAVGALDNLDHNPSSMTSKQSFHRTGISLFQFPTTGNQCRNTLSPCKYHFYCKKVNEVVR